MKLALDSSVLHAIFNNEKGADAWLDALVLARKEGQLIVCDVVYAELAPAFETEVALKAILARIGATYDPVQAEAAWLAGVTFKAYRRAGGARKHLIPDFLVAAHAYVQADRLAAQDRGYFRTYFPDLRLLQPVSGPQRG